MKKIIISSWFFFFFFAFVFSTAGEHIVRIGRERLTFQNSWAYIESLEQKKNYSSLVSILERELAVIEVMEAKIRKGLTLSNEDKAVIHKTYSRYGSKAPFRDFLIRNRIDPELKTYDIEGKVYILDNLTEIYCKYLVNFKKAIFYNTMTSEAYDDLQRIGLNNIPISDFYNKRRALFYYFYPLSTNAVNDVNASGQSFRAINGNENFFFGRIDLATLFPKYFLDIVRREDLERLKNRVIEREEYINKKLGLSLTKQVANSFDKDHIERIESFIEKQKHDNAYYKFWFLASEMWLSLNMKESIDSESYEKLLYYCEKALESVEQKLQNETDSYNMLNYWIGSAYLRKGKIIEGSSYIERFFDGIDEADVIEERYAKSRIDVFKQIEEERIRKVEAVELVGAFISLALSVGGTISSLSTTVQTATQSYSNANSALHAADSLDKAQFISNITQLAGSLSQLALMTSASKNLREDIERRMSGLVSPLVLKVGRYLNKFEQVELYADLAKSYEANGNIDKAIKYLKEALCIIELQRTTISSETQKISFANIKEQLYSEIITLLVQNDNPQEAFKYLERAKSRALLDVLGSKKLVLKNIKETEDFSAIMIEKDEISILLDQTGLSAQQLRAIALKWTKGTDSVKDNRRGVEFETLTSIKTIKFSGIAKITEKDFTILEYFITDKAVYLFLFDQGKLYIKEMPFDKNKLFLLIKSFRGEITNPKGVISTDYSQELYDLLIAPVRSYISKNRLYIIPHGWLHYIPFQALINDGRYLVEDFAITYAPSATILKIWLNKEKRNKSTAFILGNPDIGEKGPDLHYAEKEAISIGKIFKTKEIIGKSATESVFKEHANKFDVIHIAAHASFDSNNPLNSYIWLSKDSNNDGQLKATEFYQMNLRANLLTMSACETGLSYVSKGDETLGLCRGVMYAGVNSILSSLWSVEDESTEYLMTKFYENLKTMPKDISLQKAQLQTMGNFLQCYKWAPFILTGNKE